jgi:hypothetical protein
MVAFETDWDLNWLRANAGYSFLDAVDNNVVVCPCSVKLIDEGDSWNVVSLHLTIDCQGL